MSYAKYSSLNSEAGVTSVNSETGAIDIVAGAGITVTPSGNNITIASTDASFPVTQNLYVDGSRTDSFTSDGSLGKPFLTISAAIAQIITNADNATVPYTINVAPFTYAESLSFNNALLYNIVISNSMASAEAPLNCVVNDVTSTSNNTNLGTLVINGLNINGNVNLTGDITGTNFGSTEIQFINCQFNETSETLVLNNVNNVNFYNCQIQGASSVLTFTNVAFGYMSGGEGIKDGSTLNLVDNPGGNIPSQYGGNYLQFSQTKFYGIVNIDAGSELDSLESYFGGTSVVASDGLIHSWSTNWSSTGTAVTLNSGATMRVRGDFFYLPPVVDPAATFTAEGELLAAKIGAGTSTPAAPIDAFLTGTGSGPFVGGADSVVNFSANSNNPWGMTLSRPDVSLQDSGLAFFNRANGGSLAIAGTLELWTLGASPGSSVGLLTVATDTNNNVYFDVPNDGGARGINFLSGTGLPTYMLSLDRSFKRVGINTPTPAYTLDVTGEGNFNSNQIHTVADPTSAQDVATKHYVDTHGTGAFAQYASSQVTTNSSNVSSASFVTFDNSPAFTFTPTLTGTYKVYASATIDNNSAGGDAVVRIFNTSGSATLLEESQCRIASENSTEILASLYIQSVYTLTAGTSYQFDIQGKLNGGTNFSMSGSIAPFYMFAEGVGLSTSSPTGSYASAYFGNASSWSTSSPTYADPTNSGGNTLTVRQNANITLTAAASNVCGITFTPASANAVYQITVNTSVAEDTTSQGLGIQLTDGSVIVSAPPQVDAVAGTLPIPMNLFGIYAPSTTSPVTLKLQLYATGGSSSIQGQGLVTNSSVEWTVLRIA